MSADPCTAPEPDLADDLRAAEAAAVRRLRALTAHDDAKLALRACEAVVKFSAQFRRADGRARPAVPRAEGRREPRPAPPAAPAPAAVKVPERPSAVRADGTPLRSWLKPE